MGHRRRQIRILGFHPGKGRGEEMGASPAPMSVAAAGQTRPAKVFPGPDLIHENALGPEPARSMAESDSGRGGLKERGKTSRSNAGRSPSRAQAPPVRRRPHAQAREPFVHLRTALVTRRHRLASRSRCPEIQQPPRRGAPGSPPPPSPMPVRAS